MVLSGLNLNMREKSFTAELDSGPGYDAALQALKMDPNYGYVLDIEGTFRLGHDGDGPVLRLEDAYVVNPITWYKISFQEAGLDTASLRHYLEIKSANDSEVYEAYYQELRERSPASE